MVTNTGMVTFHVPVSNYQNRQCVPAVGVALMPLVVPTGDMEGHRSGVGHYAHVSHNGTTLYDDGLPASTETATATVSGRRAAGASA